MDKGRLFVFSLLDRPWQVLHKGRWMTPKGAWPRWRVLLLKQWDRYPRSTERISCLLTKIRVYSYVKHAVFERLAADQWPSLLYNLTQHSELIDAYHVRDLCCGWNNGSSDVLMTANVVRRSDALAYRQPHCSSSRFHRFHSMNSIWNSIVDITEYR